VGLKTARDVIQCLKTLKVDALDLDHDLGDESITGSGYDVLEWLENEGAERAFIPPAVIKVHSANPAVYPKMLNAIESIEHLARQNVANRVGSALKVYLDDARETPVGWVRTYTVEETIGLLRDYQVVALDLDHHLGADTDENGEDVLHWLEEQVRTSGFRPPEVILSHTGNVEARPRMDATAERIHNLWRERLATGTPPG
jgi:hypothetical protein